jgi:hypothetical protein
MMGRLERDQGQLFYSFCLEEVVPDDHQVRAIASVLDLSWVYGELSPHYPALGRCACRKLNPGILVMQSAQGWATKNVPGAIDGARDRRIFLQG